MPLKPQYMFIMVVVALVAVWMIFQATLGGGRANKAEAKPTPAAARLATVAGAG